MTYDIFDSKDLKAIVGRARDHGLQIYVDDAGGARVGPAIFGQPRSLELEVDVAATGLDKYGVTGPRFGLLGGKKELVAKIRSKAWQLGLEARPIFLPAALRTLQQYNPERVRELVRTTKEVAGELKKLLGGRVHETAVTSQLLAEDLLRRYWRTSVERRNLPRLWIRRLQRLLNRLRSRMEFSGCYTTSEIHRKEECHSSLPPSKFFSLSPPLFGPWIARNSERDCTLPPLFFLAELVERTFLSPCLSVPKVCTSSQKFGQPQVLS